MHISELRLQDFRNIAFARLPTDSRRVFLLGANGQGKSNLLEALGLATACRSFRTQNLAVLPRQGCERFALLYQIEHEQLGATELQIESGGSRRRVQIDGETLNRLGDFIGRFPVVAMSSGDLQLLRGGPADRRRFLDLTLSAKDPAYYEALRGYHRGIAERNRLLKQGGSEAELTAFEAEIAPRAVCLQAARSRLAETLGQRLGAVYDALAEDREGPFLDYRPSAPADDAAAVQARLQADRRRDGLLGATQRGPHRDDFVLGLEVGGARDYASDGQQRALCVALRLAQAEVFRSALGIIPVLLADDVLGELDPRREAGFWQACPTDMQIIASGTEPPKDAADWVIRHVENGALKDA